MSIFSSIASGISKSVGFLITIFTKTSTIAAQISKLSPGVLAAMLAVFYDVVKAAQAVEGAAVAASTGDFISAGTFSETTLSLIKSVVADAKAAESVVVADLKLLGIVKSDTTTV